MKVRWPSLPLSTVAQIVSIGALTLPLVGAIVRFWGLFVSNKVPLYVVLAAAAPIDQLAITAVPTVITTGSILVFFHVVRTYGPHSMRLMAVYGALSDVMRFLSVRLLRRKVLDVPFSMVGPLIAALVGGFRRHSTIGIALVFLASGLAWGYIYRGEVAGYYEFGSPVAPNGWYARLGTSEGLVYLMPCHEPGSALDPEISVIAVRSDAIESVYWPPAATDTPLGFFPLGLRPNCPARAGPP